METEILQRIRSINHEFYQTFADSFAETRARLQPGVERLMPSIANATRILELGSGNGELISALLKHGFKGYYLGLDLSERMLAIARAAVQDTSQVSFHQAELGKGDLSAQIRRATAQAVHPPYDQLVCFATLHHIPGHAVRERLVRELRKLTDDGGRLYLSVWNFMQSERLRARVLPWDTVGIDEQAVEPGDYLIDWRRDGEGIRYVHHFTEEQLVQLAEQAGFLVRESFTSDGEPGTLGLYQIWET